MSYVGTIHSLRELYCFIKVTDAAARVLSGLQNLKILAVGKSLLTQISPKQAFRGLVTFRRSRISNSSTCMRSTPVSLRLEMNPPLSWPTFQDWKHFTSVRANLNEDQDQIGNSGLYNLSRLSNLVELELRGITPSEAFNANIGRTQFNFSPSRYLLNWSVLSASTF